jgi:hypothetical protein
VPRLVFLTILDQQPIDIYHRCSNLLKNLNWIISYGDVVNNQKTSQALDAIERLVQEKKNEVMKDVVKSSMDLPEGLVDWPGICTRKRKPNQRLKGVAG